MPHGAEKPSAIPWKPSKKGILLVGPTQVFRTAFENLSTGPWVILRGSWPVAPRQHLGNLPP